MRLVSVAGVFATAALVSFAAPSYAALLSCPAEFTTSGTAKVHDGAALAGNVTAASQCQYIDPPDNSNTADEASVNLVSFFGTNTWDQVGDKIDLPDGVQSGTWAISGTVDFAGFDYMITFKDGQGTNLISFLLNELFSAGGWDSPFANPPFTTLEDDQVKDVSHFAIFRREGGGGGEEQVSEPSVLALLGLSLLMLGFLRRRKANA